MALVPWNGGPHWGERALCVRGSTAVPLVFGGLVLGPAVGYVYAGEASPGPELVLAGAVVAAGGVITAFLIGRDIIQVGDRVRARN